MVIAGGTGRLGQMVASGLSSHDVTILCRNRFLASATNRVTGAFGWVGSSFLEANPHVMLRDWDGGDLLDIVGCDWVGWQEDVLTNADVVVNLVGGYTHQRLMATERIVQESNVVNPSVLQITVSPLEEDIPALTPGAQKVKIQRLRDCEDAVRDNCRNHLCLRLEAFKLKESCQTIVDAVENAPSSSSS